MADAWETYSDGTRHFVIVTEREVVTGSGSGHSELAGAVGHDEFLAGSMDDALCARHGALVLRALADAVRTWEEYRFRDRAWVRDHGFRGPDASTETLPDPGAMIERLVARHGVRSGDRAGVLESILASLG